MTRLEICLQFIYFFFILDLIYSDKGMKCKLKKIVRNGHKNFYKGYTVGYYLIMSQYALA